MTADESTNSSPLPRWRRWLRWLRWLLLPAGVIALLLGWMWAQVWLVPARKAIPVSVLPQGSPPPSRVQPPKKRLRLLTLNVAHGRREALHQLFVPTATIRRNLLDVATMLRKEAADAVALQETDGPSWWSGNFHHVRFLAQKAGYRYVAFARLIDIKGLRYGTALLSRFPLKNTRHVTMAVNNIALKGP